MQLFDPIPDEHADALEAGLTAYNRLTTSGKSEFLIAELDGARLVGGIRASVSRGALYIKHLWIDESARKQGLGSKLMLEAEAEGSRRGARQACVDTFSTQAPEFYEKIGI